MEFIDTHSHNSDPAFRGEEEEVIARAVEAGVSAMIQADIDSSEREAMFELVSRHPGVLYPMLGLYPCSVDKGWRDEIDSMLQWKDKGIVAIGEIGLDYYWAENPPREFQQEIFRRQIELAIELDLPLIVHDREAHGDCLAIVREYPEARGVFHCFSGSPEMAEELLRRGWYLGFDGPITYKNARRAPEVAAVTPLERMVVETDSPYLSPVPNRGRRNDSRNLCYIVETLAAWKGISPEELARVTLENGKRLFGLA